MVPGVHVCLDMTAEVVPEPPASLNTTREEVPLRALEGISEIPACPVMALVANASLFVLHVLVSPVQPYWFPVLPDLLWWASAPPWGSSSLETLFSACTAHLPCLCLQAFFFSMDLAPLPCHCFPPLLHLPPGLPGFWV